MYTSFVTVTLIIAPVLAAPDSPAWMTSYSAALAAGQKQSKPVAVFVGSGAKGQFALVKEGQFSADTLKVLGEKYVCVYLDRSHAANERLVRELSITKSGMVISDRTGNFQAFHHDGVLPQAELAQQLRRYADPGFVLSNTTSNTNSRVSYYSGANGSTSFSGRTVNC